jgi:hypothetical protein
MSAMSTRTIELDRSDLDKSIEVLSSAAQALQLTRFQSLSYRALMISADAATVLLFASSAIPLIINTEDLIRSNFFAFFIVVGILFDLSIFVGIVSLLLSIPLFVRVFRERARLKKLGLSSLSKSLWMESRRSRWITRGRGWLLLGTGVFLLLGAVQTAVVAFLEKEQFPWRVGISLAVFFALTAVFVLAARYLRNQRERMALTADVEELRRAAQNLRERAGNAEVVTVPSELLEQTAKIESAQIASERKDAVLQSIASPSKEYAVAFDRSAVKQRATLDIADRMELEDLVEQVGAEATESQAGTGTITALRAATKSKRIEIDYLIDQASHRIRITAVRPGIDGSPASSNGATHA